MAIDWKKYFDGIWLISHLPYKGRREAVLAELDRVGITSHPSFHVIDTIKSPWQDEFLEHLKKVHRTQCRNVGELNCALAHYEVLKKAQLLGMKMPLILEDDVRFTKDIGRVERALEAIPAGADIVMLDYLRCCLKAEFDAMVADKVNDVYSRFTGLGSTACYAVSKRAVDALVAEYEKSIIQSDCYWMSPGVSGLLKVFCVDNVAIQKPYEDSITAAVFNEYVGVQHRLQARTVKDFDVFNL